MHQPTDEQLKVSEEITPSHWTILARSAADFGELAADPRWRPLNGSAAAWTDDYSNIIGTVRW
jgi:hypothetical protein